MAPNASSPKTPLSRVVSPTGKLPTKRWRCSRMPAEVISASWKKLPAKGDGWSAESIVRAPVHVLDRGSLHPPKPTALPRYPADTPGEERQHARHADDRRPGRQVVRHRQG